MLRQNPGLYTSPPPNQPNHLYAASQGHMKAPARTGLVKEGSASTIVSHASDATTADSHASTGLSSIDEAYPDAEDAGLQQIIGPQMALMRQSQQKEDAERARKQIARHGADWFDIYHGERAVPTRLEKEVPYPLLYASQSHNWYMVQHLLRSRMFESPTFTHSVKRAERSQKPLPPPPRRVLDLGCGVYAPWIVEMAQCRGWEETRFVGLDIAPILLPLERLPVQYAQRMSFVQSNFLQRLPFDDGTFDFVRLADAGHGVPEDQWPQVLDEARRVAGQGLVEIASLGVAKELTSNISVKVSQDEPEDLLKSVKLREMAHLTDVHSAVFQHRLISPFPLSHIPFALVLGSKMLDKSGTIPLPFKFDADDTDEEASMHDAQSRKSTAHNPAAQWAESLDDTSGRVSLAAHTSHHCSLKERMRDDWLARDFGKTLSWKDHTDIFESFKTQRSRQSGLVGVLGGKWNWHCEMDLHSERSLHHNLKVLREELQTAKAQLDQSLKESGTSGSQNKYLSTQEIERQVRETENELRTCRVRLGKEDPTGGVTVGEPFIFEFGAFLGGPSN